LYLVALIPAIMVFVYNRGRKRKIGFRRVWSGLGVGLAGIVIFLIVLSQSNS
jgi:hypothetical protein